MRSTWSRWLSVTLLFLTLSVGLFAAVRQQPNPASGPTTAQSDSEANPSTVTEYHLPPDKLQRALALYRTDTLVYVVGTIYSIAILVILVALRIGPAYRNIAERLARQRFLQTLIFVPILTITIDLLELPISLYGHHIALAYGLSIQKWLSWFWDWTKGELIGIALGTLLVWLMYWVIRKSPQRWWFYFWLVSLPIMVFLVFLAPVVLDPIFNKFEPLEKTDPQLVSQLERVVKRGGLDIPPSRMYLMKASEKVTTYNAYVTGLGPSKRVVVWDTTAREMTIPETLFVFGHEMGHYVLNHIYQGLIFSAVLLFFGLWLGRQLILWMLRRWRTLWDIREVGDLASLPAIMLVFAVLTFFGQPIGNMFSRHIEHQADIYGLEITHGLIPDSSQVAAQSFQKLGEKSFDYPYPNRFFVDWTYSHPPIADRVRFALTYHPWDEGKPNQFVRQ